MSDAAIFVLVFGGLFVLRAIAATVVFFYILPRGDRCPNCDAITVRIQGGVLNRVVPSLRSSWCMECGWSGTLRRGPLTPQLEASERSRIAAGMQKGRE
jgi:hypothetical protein